MQRYSNATEGQSVGGVSDALELRNLAIRVGAERLDDGGWAIPVPGSERLELTPWTIPVAVLIGAATAAVSPWAPGLALVGVIATIVLLARAPHWTAPRRVEVGGDGLVYDGRRVRPTELHEVWWSRVRGGRFAALRYRRAEGAVTLVEVRIGRAGWTEDQLEDVTALMGACVAHGAARRGDVGEVPEELERIAAARRAEGARER